MIASIIIFLIIYQSAYSQPYVIQNKELEKTSFPVLYTEPIATLAPHKTSSTRITTDTHQKLPEFTSDIYHQRQLICSGPNWVIKLFVHGCKIDQLFPKKLNQKIDSSENFGLPFIKRQTWLNTRVRQN